MELLKLTAIRHLNSHTPLGNLALMIKVVSKLVFVAILMDRPFSLRIRKHRGTPLLRHQTGPSSKCHGKRAEIFGHGTSRFMSDV